MGELIFIGLGLNGIKSISLEGLEIIKSADEVFIELYTSIMPDFSLKELKSVVGKEVKVLSRRDLEDLSGKAVLDEAKKGKRVALLTPGDPLIATTHISLRLLAEKAGVTTKVIHSSSIISAAISASGLHCYKFGRIVTITSGSETPYDVLRDNMRRGLHTLFLLDMDVERGYFMSVSEALNSLLEIENKRKENVISPSTLALVLSRVGSSTSCLKCDVILNLMKLDFGSPPHAIIIPGRLHFMEAEALITLADAPKKLVENLVSRS